MNPVEYEKAQALQRDIDADEIELAPVNPETIFGKIVQYHTLPTTSPESRVLVVVLHILRGRERNPHYTSYDALAYIRAQLPVDLQPAAIHRLTEALRSS